MSQDTTQEILEEESENIEEQNEVVEENNTSEEEEETSTQDNETSESKDWFPSDEELGNLTDEEFEEYYASGKFPEGKKSTSKSIEKSTEPTQDEESPTEKVSEEKVIVEDKQNEKKTPSKEEATQELTSDQYKDFYNRLMSPFKANGKTVTPRSAEDIISLMQMGANYSKKMQALAPVRKQAQSLINSQIDDNELSFLIDLHNGNKDAIKQLLKRNNIDVTDIDLDEESKYQTNLSNLANDKDVAFQDAILDAKANIPKINDILSNTWDSESKSLVLGDANLLKGLNYEVESGRFNQIQPILEQERMMGRYEGVSDIRAYVDILDRLALQEQQQRALQNQGNSQSTSKQRKTPRTIPQAGDKSKAAPSKGKTAPSKNNITKEMLFDMSDEDFEKLQLKDIV